MPRRSHLVPIAAASAALLQLSACAVFRGDRPHAEAASDSPAKATAMKAAEIGTQPARDVGAAKPEIPPVLIEATNDPYSRASTATCTQIADAITALNEHLGPDYLLAGQKEESKAGKIAEAGGRTVVNTIIPFRGLVRELTGAAEAKRRYDDAVDAGYARRGYLRGLQSAKGCLSRP
jgi:hypothetical protein